MPHKAHIIAAALLVLSGTSFAEELRGKITGSKADEAQISLEGNLVPNVGDQTTIYFKLPGSDDEVLVANGHVTAVDGGTATVTIDKSFGTVQKDQLARIVSNAPKPKAESSQPGTAPTATDQQKQVGDVPAEQRAESSPSGPAQSWAELDNQARDFYTQGRFSEAIAVLDRAIELNPRNGDAYLRRALCSWGDASKAVADATRALELQCDLPAKAYSTRGRAHYFLKNYRPALDDASKAIEIQPDASEPYTVRGLARLGLGENNGALTDFNKAIALDPNNGEAYFGRGSYYATIRAMDEADEEWKKAVALQPSLKPAVDSARSWFAQGGAQTAQSTTSAASGSTTGPKASPEKRDLRSRLIGKWKGGRHTTLYKADGTSITDPDLTPQPIRESVATWRVEGDQLIENVAGQTLVSTIVSITSRELVLRDVNGTWHFKRVK